jgi:kynurenine formamidase
MTCRTIYLVVPALAAAFLLVPAGTGADAPGALGKKKLTKADVEGMMRSLSNWGRWGAEDQLGTLNFITPEKRRQAAALVKEGTPVSLARNVIKEAIDDSPAFIHRMVGLPREGQEIASSGDEYSVQYHGFTQTHLDGLCHLMFKGKMYNGFAQTEVGPKGARKLGIEQFKNGIFTRCVLMDLPRLHGLRFLEGGRAIYPEDLEAWERKAGVQVERGDAVLIRTGRWTRRELEGPWNILKNSAGLHASCVPWLKKRDVALVGSDLALDVLPSGVEGFELPVHWMCVVGLGTPILDNCDLEKVSAAAEARKRWSFLLTVAPLAVEGGTGSPVNPLAVF